MLRGAREKDLWGAAGRLPTAGVPGPRAPSEGRENARPAGGGGGRCARQGAPPDKERGAAGTRLPRPPPEPAAGGCQAGRDCEVRPGLGGIEKRELEQQEGRRGRPRQPAVAAAASAPRPRWQAAGRTAVPGAPPPRAGPRLAPSLPVRAGGAAAGCSARKRADRARQGPSVQGREGAGGGR